MISGIQLPHTSIRGDCPVNVAAFCPASRALGPGLRAVLWVQGCPFSCPGCISPEWARNVPNQLITPEELAPILLSNPEVTGITFSGGEPFAQAEGLGRLAVLLRREREVNIICYTGYRLEELRQMSRRPGIDTLLAQVDVLIDGLYMDALNDNLGLRGSSNQRFHLITKRIPETAIKSAARSIEIHIQDGAMLMAGIPPKDIPAVLHQSVQQVQRKGMGGIHNVRS